jgi:hypothetical protein
MAVLVDGPGHELLARPALSEDRHRDVGMEHPLDLLGELLHRGGVADEAGHGLRAAEAALQLPQVLGQPSPLRGPSHREQEPLPFEGLGHEVVRAGPHRPDRRLDAPRGGHHDDRELRVRRQEMLEHVEPRHVLQAEVEAHDAGAVALQRLPSLAHLPGGEAVVGEPVRHQPTNDRVVVDDHHVASLAFRSHSPWAYVGAGPALKGTP